MTDRFVDPAVAGERFDRLRVVIERSALAANEARVGRVEEVLVEGPSKKDPTVARRPHRRSTGSSTSRRPAPLRAGVVRRPSRSPAPRRTTSTGRFVELVAEPRAPRCASPSPPAER